eukprot:1138790-Pelagomonas_calceolata.AAC.6
MVYVNANLGNQEEPSDAVELQGLGAVDFGARTARKDGSGCKDGPQHHQWIPGGQKPHPTYVFRKAEGYCIGCTGLSWKKPEHESLMEKHRAAKGQFDKVKGTAHARKAEVDRLSAEVGCQFDRSTLLRAFFARRMHAALQPGDIAGESQEEGWG